MSENKVTDPTTGEQVEVIDIQLYALNLSDDGRVLSAAGDQYGDTFGHSEPPSELGIRKLGIKNLEWMECAWGARFEIGPAEPETQFPTPHFSFLM